MTRTPQTAGCACVTRYYGVDGLNMEDITTDITTARLTHKAGQPERAQCPAAPWPLRPHGAGHCAASGGVSAGVPVTDNTQIAPGAKLRGSLNETTVFSLDYTR